MILLWTFLSKAQGLDSLFLLLKQAKADTSITKLEAKISWEYRESGDYTNAFKYGESALFKSEKIHFNTGIASACNALAAIYDEQGQYPKSLSYYTRAMTIHELQHDEAGICRDNNNIGLLYVNLLNYKTALNYYNNALQIALKLKKPNMVSAIYINMGGANAYINEHEKSSQYYFKALEISTKLKDQISISDCYTNIGINYTDLLQYDKALKYCNMGLIMKKQLNDQHGIAASFINIGETFSRQGKYIQAKPYFDSALTVSGKIGSADNLRLSYQALSDVNYELKNYKEAYTYQVKFKDLTDSLFNSENNEELNQTKLNYELDKKALEQAQLKALANSDKKRQNSILLCVGFVLIIVCVFSFFLYKRFKIINKQKKIISKQKDIVEIHQKEIADSINYAKRIQTSFLANELDFKNNFNDHFILFKPKDIVSGDFYWATKIESKLMIAVADSTGHGIPGAFMSLLNISLLNESVFSRNYTSTVDILNFVRAVLILGLKSDASGHGGNDGMDCTLFSIDTKTLELEFSGANNPLWIIRDGELIELKANKMPVGRSPKELESFSSQKFSLQTNDSIYAFTDGFPDQFGGPKGKKFMYKKLEELLKTISNKPMSEQKVELNNVFKAWQGNLEQVDDVCLIGIRI
jgi:serine phosphatase RsbU (regulator of sigma subunit)